MQLGQQRLHRHVEQAVEQREHARHEGDVLLVAVAAVLLAQVFQRRAAQRRQWQQQVRRAVRILARVQQQLQPALQLAPADAVDRVLEAGDRDAAGEGRGIHQLQQVVGQRGILFQLEFQFLHVGVARQQGEHGQHALARGAVVVVGQGVFQHVVAAEPGEAGLLAFAVAGDAADLVGQVRSEQGRQRMRARRIDAAVARHRAQRQRRRHAVGQWAVDEDAVALHLQLGQAARHAVAGQRAGGYGQQDAAGKQHVQGGRIEDDRVVQAHDAIERRYGFQQVRRTEDGLQEGAVYWTADGIDQQRDPFVLCVGDGA
jgi:hypothetical protein